MPTSVHIKKLLFLLAVGTIFAVALFWYINTYVYKSNASEDVVTVNLSTSTTAVNPSKDFMAIIDISGQKIVGLDFSLIYDGDLLTYFKEANPNESGIIQTPIIYDDIVLEKVSDANDIASGKKRLRVVLLSKNPANIPLSQRLSLKFTAKITGMATIELENNKFDAVGNKINNTPVDFTIDFQNSKSTISISVPPTPIPTSTHTPTSDPCPSFTSGNADCSLDGHITLVDFACFRYEYINHKVSDNCGGVQHKSADFNNSNSVTLFDFAIWRSSYINP